MRASVKLLYALTISAGVSLFTACGTPPTETTDGGDTLCADGKADDPNCVQPDGGPPDGGNPADAGTQPDGGPPPDPCAGFVVPLATKCAGDFTPVTCVWQLYVSDDGKVCYLGCAHVGSCIMLPEYSGAEQVDCHVIGVYLLSCTMQ